MAPQYPDAWLSWLERRVHIAEIAGSIPAASISDTLDGMMASHYIIDLYVQEMDHRDE
jgi:hypothetical protein